MVKKVTSDEQIIDPSESSARSEIKSSNGSGNDEMLTKAVNDLLGDADEISNEAEKEEDQETEKPKKNEEESKEETKAVIQADDGEHIIPLDEMKKERARAQKAHRKIEELESQMAELRGQLTSQQKKEETQSDKSDLPIHLQSEKEIFQFIQKIRDNAGDEAADTRLELIDLKRERHNEKVVAEEQQTLFREQQAEREKIETSRMQKAVQENPLMNAWYSDADSFYYNWAIDIDKNLLKTDPEYAELPYSERIKLLTVMTEARHKPSPHSEKLSESHKQPVKAKARKLPETPTSISDLPGGQPKRQVSVLDTINNKSGEELTRMLQAKPSLVSALVKNLGKIP